MDVCHDFRQFLKPNAGIIPLIRLPSTALQNSLFTCHPITQRRIKTGEKGQLITTTPLQCLIIHCVKCSGFSLIFISQLDVTHKDNMILPEISKNH
jgi:hypothetical protein